MVGHTGDVTAVVTAFITNMPHCSAQNGSKQLIVISGSRDCQLIVWDATTGSEIHILRHHRQPITCLSVSVDGSVLISGKGNGSQILIFHHGHSLRSSEMISDSWNFSLEFQKVLRGLLKIISHKSLISWQKNQCLIGLTHKCSRVWRRDDSCMERSTGHQFIDVRSRQPNSSSLLYCILSRLCLRLNA